MDEQGRQKFGAYLRTLRSAKKVTQKDAAAQAVISGPYLAQLEKGQRNPPSRSVLSRLARVYGAAPQELWLEAEYAESNTERPFKRLDPERVQWAFQAMLNDPAYSFGTRLRGKGLTLEAKAMLIEIYQKSMNRQLLTPEELEPGESEGNINDSIHDLAGDSDASD